MTTSSFSTANVKDTALEAFFAGAGIVPNEYEQTFDWRFDENVAAIKVAPWSGVPNMTVWDPKTQDLPDNSPDALDPKTMVYVVYGMQVRLSPFDEEEVPGLVQDVLREIGFSAASTSAAAAAAAKAAAFSVADAHGTKTLIASDHLTRSGATRSNKVTSAIDRTACLNLQKVHETWLTFEDRIVDVTQAGFYLEFHPTNKDTLNQVFKSSVVGSNMQYNTAGEEFPTFIKNPYLATDKLIMGVRAPGKKAFLGWLRKRWQVRPVKGENNETSKFNVFGALAFGHRGVPDGVSGLSTT